MKNYIDKYIHQDFKIFACNTDKTPATPKGFYNASSDLSVLEKQFYKDEMFIGFPTGNINGITVIDIDVKDGMSVEESLENLKQFGEIPETLQIETPSGGRHLYFKTDHTKISSSARFFNKNLSIDIRANGGYVIAPDGVNYIVYDDIDDLEIENLKKRCTPLPKWIENFKKQTEHHDNVSQMEDVLPPEEVKEIRSALSFLNSDDRDTWINVGLALKNTGSPSAYGLWDEWSKSSDKYDASDQPKRWKGLKPNDDLTIASVFHWAKQKGWTTTYEQEKEQGNLNFIITDEEIEEKKKAFERNPFPQELLRPDGLVGELAEYINNASLFYQPIYALASSLTAIATLAGRKVQTETGIRTNIYCLSVGESGSGKESARSSIKKCFQYANCRNLASVEDLASDASIITELSQPKGESQLFLIDEMGRFIQATRSSTKNIHLFKIVDVLLKLYGQANGTFQGKSYADKENQKTIEQPNLSIYGTTVPGNLYNGLTVENITDGFLSRMIIFESEDPIPEKRKNIIFEPPNDLILKIKQLHGKTTNSYPQGNTEQYNFPRPQVVKMTREASSIVDDYDDYIRNIRLDLYDKKNVVHSLYNRSSELAQKIALIIATGINVDNPIITADEIIYGINLINYITENTVYIVENFIAENEYEHNLKKILTIIRSHGKIKLSDLSRKTQYLKTYERNDVLENLMNSAQISEYETGKGHQKQKWYVAIG